MKSTLVLAAAVVTCLTLSTAAHSQTAWGTDKGRAYAVSSVTDGVTTTHHIYFGVVLNGSPYTIIGSCVGIDLFNCNVARLGSCTKTSTVGTVYDWQGNSYTESKTSCVSPGAGSCKAANGPLGGTNWTGNTLVVDSMANGVGCAF